MIAIRMIMIVILMICLISCETPSFKPVLQCDISFKFDRCRCRCFDINKMETVGPKECGFDIDVPDWNLSPEMCEGFVGFHYETWGRDIIPKAKELYRYYQDTCQ